MGTFYNKQIDTFYDKQIDIFIINKLIFL